ncbi:hypothetical protein KVV02_008017 [Mortierella alpina]|uniref:Uncharacterized protein n=1 Tax=Mortierella alpina TaxID=64518 RepID=A0A9P8AC40_MORAP|nr:hypothetical protein KVV02_008017 [Mortierella alpina]
MLFSKSLLLSVTLVTILSVTVAARSLGPTTELKRRNSDIVLPETASKEDYKLYAEDDDYDDYGSSEANVLAAAPHTALKTRDFKPRKVMVIDENNFCIFYPPDGKPGSIAQRYDATEACCTGPQTLAFSACRIPDDLITPGSIRYEHSDKKYVEITGKLNVAMLHTNDTDDGVGYTEHTLDDSFCAGHPHYIELLEPNEGGFFLLRCCDDTKYCSAENDTLSNGAKAFLQADLNNNYPNL